MALRIAKALVSSKFEEDLDTLTNKACNGEDYSSCKKLLVVKQELVSLYKKNLVKINHSAMELVCAKALIKLGYDVKVEYKLSENLVCDLYCIKGEGTMIVEVETGFVSPEHALQPLTYYYARLSSKISRYSAYSNKFALGTPPNHILPLPSYFVKPPRYRSDEEAWKVKKLCDIYYQNPPIRLEDIKYARLHSVFIIDVDNVSAEEIDPETYIQSAQNLRYMRMMTKY
ncbi:MAG: hypothetical protein QXJ17_02345 [Nitrososphaeria archaeon]